MNPVLDATAIVRGRMRLAALAAPALLLLSPPTVHAAAPANDDLAGAIAVPGLPFSDALDTTDATTEPADAACIQTVRSVWYQFTPDEDVHVLVDTFGSDFDTTLAVFTDPPDGVIDCNDDAEGLQSAVAFQAAAGETYYIRAGSLADGPGGDLHIHFDYALDAELELAPQGTVDPQTGEAVVSGTLTCTGPGGGYICGELKQKLLGHQSLAGGFCQDIGCDAAGEFKWTSAPFTAQNGLFKVGGKATLSATVLVCDAYACAEPSATGPIKLTVAK